MAADLSCEFENFWEKKIWQTKKNLFFFGRWLAPHQKIHQGSENFFLRLVDPCGNRLVSTAFKNCLQVDMHQNKIKIIQIYMKNLESDEWKEKSNFRFFPFLFFELWSFLSRHHPNFRCIFTITWKTKIAKNFHFVFHSIQHIPHIS